jgi:alkylation response protein AidB-like acyl-CoA dehydrogenase
MPTALTDDQTLFHETTLRFIETELPLTQTRALHGDPVGYKRQWLQKSAEIGWFTLLIPESEGGGSVSGQGLLDAVIVAEEVGRHVQPGPFIPMNIVAGGIAFHGTKDQRRRLLPGIATGEAVATWAFADASGNWDAGAGLHIELSGTDLVVTGHRGFVQDAVSADWLLVVATLDNEPVQILIATDTPGVHIEPLTCLDLSRRMANVGFDHVVLTPDAVLESGGIAALERQLLWALVLNCADTIGAIDALFAMTVGYAKDRIAFGRPIGSFQALKHVMADQALNLEACKAGAVAAGRAVQERLENASEVASMAAAFISDVANEVAQECLQIHGGIGYTWEHDLHLLLRRVRSNGGLFGESSWHRERVCAFHRIGEGSAQ